jgi:hypothetical protein
MLFSEGIRFFSFDRFRWLGMNYETSLPKIAKRDPIKVIQAIFCSEIRGSCQSTGPSNIYFQWVLLKAYRVVPSARWIAGQRRFLARFQPIIDIYPAYAAQRVGNPIHQVGMPKGHKILMEFIADAVKRRRNNTYKNQQIVIILERQGRIGSEKQDAQHGIGPKMQEFV